MCHTGGVRRHRWWRLSKPWRAVGKSADGEDPGSAGESDNRKEKQ